MKQFSPLIALLIGLWTVDCGLSTAHAQKFSDYPNTNNLATGDIVLFSHHGTGTFSIDLSTPIPSWELGTAAFTDASAYEAAGASVTAATAATNGLGTAAFKNTNTFDLAGTGVAAATAATNGFPWGVLYDAAGTALSATNGMNLASGLAAFRSTNSLASTNAATASTRGLVKVDNSTITVAADGTISATTGGGGTVTSVNVAENGHTSSGAVTTSGTITLTRTADENFLGFGATNLGILKVGGSAGVDSLVVTNGTTNLTLTASTLLKADANKKVSSIANAAGVYTNDGSGGIGIDNTFAHTNQFPAILGSPTGVLAAFDSNGNIVGTNNGVALTNTIPHTPEGTTTNITFTFNGTLQTFTVTNGPTVFLTPSGANGSVSFKFTTNATIKFLGFYPAWLAGSNALNPVITNGVLSLTSYGGTNCATKGSEQIEAAMKENQ